MDDIIPQLHWKVLKTTPWRFVDPSNGRRSQGHNGLVNSCQLQSRVLQTVFQLEIDLANFLAMSVC